MTENTKPSKYRVEISIRVVDIDYGHGPGLELRENITVGAVGFAGMAKILGEIHDGVETVKRTYGTFETGA